jgi:hypothetical protein
VFRKTNLKHSPEDADELLVRRANVVIVAFGLMAAVALGLMMRHLAELRGESLRDLGQREVRKVFGGRLAAPAQLSYRDDGRRVVITIQPRLPSSSRRLAVEVGQFVWRHMDGDEAPEEVEVITIQGAGGSQTRLVVERPYISTKKLAPSPVVTERGTDPKAVVGSPQPGDR